MAGRKQGSKNKNHSERTGQVTLKVSPALLRRWKSACAQMGTTMSARFEQIVKQDVATYDTFGAVSAQTEPAYVSERRAAQEWSEVAE